jgi:cullin 1
MSGRTASGTSSPMPPVPNREDIGATWNYLQAGITRVMTDLERGIDMQMYMGVYTAVHNFCTSQKAVGFNGGPTMHATHRGAHLLGEELYNKLIAYLQNHLEGLVEKSKSHTDEALLAYYIREWGRYTTAAKYIHHLFRYLNRHWVKREIDEGKKYIYDVYTLHLVQWRKVLFEQRPTFTTVTSSFTHPPHLSFIHVVSRVVAFSSLFRRWAVLPVCLRIPPAPLS